MLYKNFNQLDSDYITLKSKFLLTENLKEFLKGIEILAEKGQVNAIQEYYFFKKTEQTNSRINKAALELLQKPDATMEELYAVGMFFERATVGSVEEKREILAVCRSAFKNEKARNLSAQKFFHEAVAKGREEMMDCMWDGPYKNGIICERLAQISILTGANAYDTANSFAKENLRKSYLRNKEDEVINFLYSTNTLRNNAISHYCERELELLAKRELSIKNEISDEAE